MSNNKAKVDQILARTKTFDYDGVEFELGMPTAVQIAELRQLQIASAQYDEDGFKSEAGLNHLTDYTTKMAAYVLGLETEDASAVIFATGGEGGGLFTAIQEFLGLKSIEDDGSTADPL